MNKDDDLPENGPEDPEENNREDEPDDPDLFNDIDDMFDDDDDDMFDPASIRADEALKEEDRRIHEMPLYQSAENIRKLTSALVETFTEKKDKLMMKEQMLMNAFMLGPKIAGAEGGDLYTLRMENAVIIKIHARDLLTQTSFCKIEKLSNPEYLQLLRDEIENFQETVCRMGKGV
ncbi:MAG TPA: hypothetical protein PKA39_04465 [Ignavibacteria bacterium]|nr:hypothetical protein [Ignavibacteria bacterium]